MGRPLPTFNDTRPHNGTRIPSEGSSQIRGPTFLGNSSTLRQSPNHTFDDMPSIVPSTVTVQTAELRNGEISSRTRGSDGSMPQQPIGSTSGPSERRSESGSSLNLALDGLHAAAEQRRRRLAELEATRSRSLRALERSQAALAAHASLFSRDSLYTSSSNGNDTTNRNTTQSTGSSHYNPIHRARQVLDNAYSRILDRANGTGPSGHPRASTSQSSSETNVGPSGNPETSTSRPGSTISVSSLSDGLGRDNSVEGNTNLPSHTSSEGRREALVILLEQYRQSLMDSRTRRSQTSESGRTPLAGNAHSGTNTQPPAGSATSSSHPTRSSHNLGPVESGSSSTTTPRPRPRLQHIGVLPPGPNRRPNSTGANVYLLSSDYDSDSDTPVSGTPRGNVNTQGSDQNQAGRSFHALPETSVLRDWDTLESTSRLTEQDILEITRISAVHALAPSLRPFFINRRLRPTGSSNDTGMEDDGITTRGRRVLARSTASRPVFDTRRTVSTQVPDPMHYRPRYSSNLFAIPSNHSFGFADHDMSNSSSPRDNFLLSQPDTGRGSNGQHGASEVPTTNQTSNRPSVGAVTTPSIPLRTSATAIRGLRRPSNPSTTGAPNPTRFTDVNTRPRDVGNRLSQMQEQLNRLRAEGDLLLSQSSDSSDTSTDDGSPRVISFTRSSGPSTRATNANTGTRSPSGSQTRASGQRLRTSVAAPTNNSVSGSGDGINHQVRQLLDDDGWSVVVESVMTRTLPSASQSAEYHSPTQTQSPAQTTLAQRRGVLTGHSHSSRSGHPTHSLPHSDSARDDLDKVTTVIDGRGVNPSTFTYSSEPFRPNPLPMKLSDMMVSTKYPRIVR